MGILNNDMLSRMSDSELENVNGGVTVSMPGITKTYECKSDEDAQTIYTTLNLVIAWLNPDLKDQFEIFRNVKTEEEFANAINTLKQNSGITITLDGSEQKYLFNNLKYFFD